jgi:hypothetical protein
MTLALADARLTGEIREISNLIFGRPYQLEVAAAIAALGTNSTIDEIYMRTRERAKNAKLDPPKEGSVRKSVERLVTAKAVHGFPAQRAGNPGYFDPNSESAFWDFALELHT